MHETLPFFLPETLPFFLPETLPFFLKPCLSVRCCSGTYRGAGPFSEIECANVRDFVGQFTGPESKTGR